MNNINYTKARKIAKQFLSVCDKSTGEVIQNPQKLDPFLINAIHALLDPHIDDLKMMINKKCNYPERRGFSWTKSEEDQLVSNFNSDFKPYEIAKIHKRSVTAILARLKKLKLIEDDIDFPTYKNKERFSVYI